MFERLNTLWMHSDSRGPFAILALFCATLTLYVMQMTWHDESSKHDPMWAQWTRRVAYSLLIFGLLWRASFADEIDNQPTPPEFLLVMSFTVMFGIRAFILHLHKNDQVARDKAARNSRIRTQ